MSNPWDSISPNANKLRQSYLKGFLDVSGGGILVRADNSLNFYTTGNYSSPTFAMDATKFVVKDATTPANTVEVTTNKLSYISDLNENVKAAFADIRSYLTGNSKSSNTDTEKLNVDTDAKIGGNLNVGGNAFFDQQVAIAGNLNIAQNLVTKGNGYFGGNLEVAGSQTINMNLYVKGDTFLNGRVFVTQDASFHANIACYGEISSAGTISTAVDLSANGALKVAGTSNLAGAATLGNTLGVAGAATLSSTLAVTGASTFTGNVQANDKLTVSNAIQGNSTLAISSTSTFGAKATISAGGLEVTGATKLNSALQAVSAVTMDSTLAVTGTSTFSDDIILNSAKKFTCGNLYVEQNKISSTNQDLVIDVVDGKKVHITGDLQIDGSFNFLGSVTQTNININVTDELFIESNGTNATMVAVQSNSATDIAKFHYDASSSTPVLVVGKSNAVCVNKATASSGIAFDVAGKSQFSDKMSLLNDLSLNGAANINGAVTMAAGKLTVSAGDTEVQKMIINGVTNATGAVTISSGKLTVSSGDTEIQLLKVNGTSQFVGAATFNAGIVLGSTFIDQW